MINIREIDHIVLRGVDLDVVLWFYCDALGCTVERRQNETGLVQLSPARSMIAFVPALVTLE